MVTKLLRTAGLAGRNSLILLTISLFVATPLQTFLLGSLASADPTGWLAAGDPEIKFSELPSGYTIPYSYNYNTDCDTTNFNVITREAKSGQAELRHNSSCAVRTVRGMSDGEYLDSGLPAGKFAGMSGSVVRIPNSKTLMSNRTVINSISVEAAFYDAIVPSYNLTTGEATFNLVGHKFLSDQANNKYYLRPGSSGFSLDG